MQHEGYGYPSAVHATGSTDAFDDTYEAAEGRMSKRRRLDGPETSWSQIGKQPPPAAVEHPYAHASLPDTFDSTTSLAYHGAVQQQDAGAAPTALATSCEVPPFTSQQWNGMVSPYPDVSSYAQPYFYQQTDPSIYTSPWPPVVGDAMSTAASFGSAAAPVQSNNMPFFPATGSATEQAEVFDPGTPSYQLFPPNDQTSNYAFDAMQPPINVAPVRNPLYLEDAAMQIKIQSLSSLDNLATQLIQTTAKASFAQIQDLMRGSDTPEGQAYVTLKDLFDRTRKVYSRSTPFIDTTAIHLFQPQQQEIIRKANIATFISSILGAHDVSFFHLNEYFIETFVPQGHRLLKWQGAMYLELKTQTYISALINSDGTPEAMLEELFPSDLDSQILARHPDAPSLSPSEQDFIDRCRARKSYLLHEPSTEEAKRGLPRKYQWIDFIREFAAYINKNVDSILNVPSRQQTLLSTLADRRALNGAQETADTSATQVIAGAQSGENAPAVPSLHKRSSSVSEKKASHSTAATVRQPWTKLEEDALLIGLERVNGPHWSQILALFGRGGSVSEVLKDRNQVQLKDKARNLKLWYLKMGREVPAALRGVTGELRKRGGARAKAALGLLDEQTEESGGGATEEEIGENVDPELGGHGNGGKKKAARK